MIMIVDYGLGNVGSIINMLKKLGAESKLSKDHSELARADKLILPGVGAFDVAMQELKDKNLVTVLRRLVLDNGVPLLGICLGMQLLGESSEEGILPGLSLIPFKNVRFSPPEGKKLLLPHIGWNRTNIVKQNDLLVKEIENNQRYYFVHSYHAVCQDRENVLMESEYGYPFTAAVSRDNVWGVQFHPEKSHQFGLRLLRNFMEVC